MALFAIALAPSLLWLWYFWRQDRATREGAGPMARAFLLGALSTIPAMILELLFMKPAAGASLLECFLVIGPAEELCKFLATRRAISRDPGFDEPSDGIVAASAVALGFAFAENLGYFAKAGPGLVVVRTLLSVPGHVLWAVFYGAALGRAQFVPGTPKDAVLKALVLASLLHGLFDALLFHAAAAPLLILLAFFWLVRFQWQTYRRLAAECAAEGRQLMDARAKAEGVVAVDSGAPLEPDVVVLDGPDGATTPARPAGFSWAAAASAFGWGIASIVAVALAWGISIGARQMKTLPDHEALVVWCIALVLGGLISAYRSPGRTVSESAFGLFLLGMLFSFVAGPLGGVICGIVMGGLGAFGGWLGEAMQSSGKRSMAYRSGT